MARRRRKGGSGSNHPYREGWQTLQVTAPVPVSIAKRLDTVSYKVARPQQLRTRTVRVPLNFRVRTVQRTVKIRVPRKLSRLPGSHAAINRGRINIYSKRNVRRLMERGEYNRRRYQEHKTRRREARHGQLESVRSDRYGMLGAAYKRGYSTRQMADVAMLARAIGGA